MNKIFACMFLIALILMLSASAIVVDKKGNYCCEVSMSLVCTSLILLGLMIISRLYEGKYFGMNIKTFVYFAFVAVLVGFSSLVIICKEEGKLIDETLFNYAAAVVALVSLVLVIILLKFGSYNNKVVKYIPYPVLRLVNNIN